jgi:hypothetical protein
MAAVRVAAASLALAKGAVAASSADKSVGSLMFGVGGVVVTRLVCVRGRSLGTGN